MQASQNVKIGSIIALLSFLIYSINDLLLKVVTTDGGLMHNVHGMQAMQVIFVTGSFALIPFILIALTRGGIETLKLKRAGIRLVLLRAFLGLINSIVVILSFKYFPMTQVYTMIFATPLLVTILSIPFLGEKVGWRRWTATIIGFIGVIIAVRPSSDLLQHPIQLAPLLIAVISSMAMIVTRRALAVERTVTIAVWNNIFIISFLIIPMFFLWKDMSKAQFIGCAISGFLGGIAVYLSMESNRFMPASQVAPFQYTQFIWGLLLDWQIFKKTPDSPWVYVGAAVIILSGVYTMFRARKVRRLRFKPRARRRLWLSKKTRQRIQPVVAGGEND